MNRIESLRELMKKEGADALVVSSLKDSIRFIIYILLSKNS